jgi:methylmalonyl-CoA/ethylmalonyl-CoA epimerase
MITRIHHVVFIVRELEPAILVYEKILGMPVKRRDRLDERGAIAARFRVGDTWIMLVQPTRTDGVPGRYLETHGEGFFLMSLGVASLEAVVDRLGRDMVDGPERTGADNWRVIDLCRERTYGAQLQLCFEDEVA